MSGTKSPYGRGDDQSGSSMNSGVTTEIAQRCAASVEYKGRKGACRREGKHPDPDGIRWWCGLHRPDRRSGRPTKQPAQKDAVGEGVTRTVASVSVRPAATDKKSKPVLQPAYDHDGRPAGRVIDTDVLVSISEAQVADSVALEALEDAQMALIEISNTNTIGWDASKPVDDYKILIEHMAGRAREAVASVSKVLRELKP